MSPASGNRCGSQPRRRPHRGVVLSLRVRAGAGDDGRRPPRSTSRSGSPVVSGWHLTPRMTVLQSPHGGYRGQSRGGRSTQRVGSDCCPSCVDESVRADHRSCRSRWRRLRSESISIRTTAKESGLARRRSDCRGRCGAVPALRHTNIGRSVVAVAVAEAPVTSADYDRCHLCWRRSRSTSRSG